LVAARMVQHNLHESDWSTVGKASLQSMSADAKENLEAIPDHWSASEISAFFTGRTDWALFASVYPCLWGEVADKLTTEEGRARALALVKSKDFRRAVENFRRTEGIAPHPAVAYKTLVQEAKVQERETQRRSMFKKRKAAEESAPAARSSTPRSRENSKRASSPLFRKKRKAITRASSPRFRKKRKAATK